MKWLTVLDDAPTLPSIFRRDSFFSKCSLHTSLNFRTDSLSAATAPFLLNGRVGSLSSVVNGVRSGGSEVIEHSGMPDRLGPEYAASGRAAGVTGHSVLFVSATTVPRSLVQAESEGQQRAELNHLSKSKLLVVDELGYLRRYEKGMLLTTDQLVRQWAVSSAMTC